MPNQSFFPSFPAISALPDVNVNGNNPMKLTHPGNYNFGNMIIDPPGFIMITSDNVVLNVASLTINPSQYQSPVGCDIWVTGAPGTDATTGNGTGGNGSDGPANVTINIQNSVTGELVLINQGGSGGAGGNGGNGGASGFVTINCPQGSVIQATSQGGPAGLAGTGGVAGLVGSNTGKVTINYH